MSYEQISNLLQHLASLYSLRDELEQRVNELETDLRNEIDNQLAALERMEK